MTEIEELREENKELKERIIRLETSLNGLYEEKMMELKSQLQTTRNRIYVDDLTKDIATSMQQVKNNILRSGQAIWEDRIRNRTEKF